MKVALLALVLWAPLSFAMIENTTELSPAEALELACQAPILGDFNVDGGDCQDAMSLMQTTVNQYSFSVPDTTGQCSLNIRIRKADGRLRSSIFCE